MEADWYYAEGGETVGPVSLQHVTGWIEQTRGASHLVWTKGMSAWAEADTLPAFSAAFASAPPTPGSFDDAGKAPVAGSDEAKGDEAKILDAPDESKPAASAKPVSPARSAALAQRARREFVEYFVISAYLYICFFALVLYKSSILHSAGVEYTAFGVAIVKALVLGKFILILHALKIGERRHQATTALANIAIKSLLFALLLFVLTIIEEVVVGYFHGRTNRETLNELFGGTSEAAFAIGLLLLLIMIPYFAFREIDDRIGEGGLLKFLKEPRSLAPLEGAAGQARDETAPPT